MDPPPSSGGNISTAPAASQPLTSIYADPAFSRSTDSWDEPAAYSAGQGGGKLRVMCSYGGNIVPRPHDKSLCYVGGDTRIIVSDRSTSLSEFSLRLSRTLLDGRSFSLKYQLPNEDLDSLISVTTDEDFENMIDEYDRISANSTTARASRLRLFLFPSKPEAPSSIGSPIESSTKSDDCVLGARNGTKSSSTNAFSDSSMVNCLLGLGYNVGNRNFKDAEGQLDGSLSGKHGRVSSAKFTSQDVHSVPPDSPMVETTSSSFGSSSSSSMGNLPPASKVHVDENHKLGIEEQLSQMTLVAGGRVEQKQKQQQEEGGGFTALSSPPAPQSPHIIMVGTDDFSSPAAIVAGEYPNRGFCDGERSDQVVYRKPPQAQPPVQMMQPSIPAPPDSISSEGSITNPLLGQQKHYIYHEPVNQIQLVSRASSNPADIKVVSDQSTRPPAQQHAVEDSVYVLPNQCDHQHPQMYLHQHQQPHAHSGQFIPAGAVPMTSYYHHPLYPSQNHPAFEHHQHQYPVYFMQARPTQPYNMHSVQQTSYSEPAVPTSNPTRPQTPSSPSFVHTPAVSTTFAASKPEMASRTAPQWVQMASGQHPQQYFGLSHMHHHPSQASAATTATYAYEFTDHPTNAQQMYYTQPLSSQMVSVRSSVLPEASYQIPVENFKQQS